MSNTVASPGKSQRGWFAIRPGRSAMSAIATATAAVTGTRDSMPLTCCHAGRATSPTAWSASFEGRRTGPSSFSI